VPGRSPDADLPGAPATDASGVHDSDPAHDERDPGDRAQATKSSTLVRLLCTRRLVVMVTPDFRRVTRR
jgi:hypothetical protein